MLVLCSYIWTVNIYTFDELQNILEESPIVYYQDFLPAPVPCPAYDWCLTDAIYIENDEPTRYTMTEEETALYSKADGCFSSNEYALAREIAGQLLNKNAKLAEAMKLVARTYALEGNWDKAIKWYQKAIDVNFYDFKAHWQKAMMLVMQNKKGKALQEITLAKILNRNMDLVDYAFKEILFQNGHDTTDWYFNPQIQIVKTCEDTVKILANPYWLSYGIHEALWLYEPGFHADDRAPEGKFDLMYSLEGFESLWDPLINSEVDLNEYPALDVLVKSIPVKGSKMSKYDSQYTLEYVLYEMALPAFPLASYYWSKDEIQKVQRYILNIRHPKIKKM